jgi:uncharacterized protein YggU (UPF0235/DUF167 family)
VIQLRSHPEGVVLALRAVPGARQSALQGEHDGALKVSVTQQAEKGKANKAIIQLLSVELGLRRSQLQLLTGLTASRKEILVREIDVPTLQARIEQALG